MILNIIDIEPMHVFCVVKCIYIEAISCQKLNIRINLSSKNKMQSNVPRRPIKSRVILSNQSRL